jgi:two-component system phosphate regulon response regulator PhoB
MAKKLNPTVLIVEDEESIVAVIKYNLKKEGYFVQVAGDGADAVEAAKKLKPDIVLLDWMLPTMSGIDVCKTIRSTPEISNTPIIMITAKSQDIDKVTGLDIGVDDYMVKPFSPAELIARIKAILRRLRPAFSGNSLNFEDIVLDLNSHSVTRNGHDIKLSPIEFQILQILMENPSRVMSRDALMDKIWGTDIYVGSRTVDVHITRLRNALLKASTNNLDVIKTIRLAGYKLQTFAEIEKENEGK